MGDVSNKAWICAAALQGALALTFILVLALTPPSFGRFLLIPVDGQEVSDGVLRQHMLDRRRPGPLPGSVIVDGQSAGVAQALLADGVLMVAAPALICGTNAESDAS